MTRPSGGGRLRGDRASATTETVLVMPALIGFLFLLVLAGRLTDARSDIVGAANDAARAASLQANLEAARIQAQRAADDTVRNERLHCIGGAPTVDVAAVVSTTDVETADFGRGTDVRVTVTCQISTSDLNFIGVGTTVTLREVAWEPIDPYRSQP
jgi:Flp pilus assembly protein TadG